MWGDERFLTEDILLMLANLRGALCWLTDGTGQMLPEARAWALARLDRQLAQLEERAYVRVPVGVLVTGFAASCAYANASGRVLEDALRQAAGPGMALPDPIFRSSRGAGAG